jgi:hypothetical protein
MADGKIQDSIPSSNRMEAKLDEAKSLNDYAMTQSSTMLAKFNQEFSNNLIGAGILPNFELHLADGAAHAAATKEALPGKDITTQPLKDSHVRASELVEGGRKSTIAEYPNGIKLTVKEGPQPETVDGRFHVVKSEAEIEHPDNLKKKGNTFVDEKGKVIIKRNDDGSYTVDSGEGFFRQGPDGIKKTSALRDRKGNFEEFNPDDPLGGLPLDDPAPAQKSSKRK